MTSKVVITNKGKVEGDVVPLVKWFINRFDYMVAKNKLYNQYKVQIILDVQF